MDVLVQYPTQIRAEVVLPCDHGQLWIKDKFDPMIIGSNLVSDIGRKFEDNQFLLSTGSDSCKNKSLSIFVLPLDKSSEMQIESPQICFKENKTTSSLGNILSMEKERDDTKSDYHGLANPGTPTSNNVLLFPVGFKIVSAMKGSRQKQGLHLKKRTISWAPDVYDPPITSRCHSVKRNTQQQHSRQHKKSLRRKLKAKLSRNGSNGKEKRRQD